MPSCSVVSDSAAPWTVAHQAPLSMGILQARILEWVAMLSSRGSRYWNIYHKLNDLKQISHLAIPELKRLSLIELKRGCQQDGISSGNKRKHSVSLSLPAPMTPASLGFCPLPSIIAARAIWPSASQAATSLFSLLSPVFTVKVLCDYTEPAFICLGYNSKIPESGWLINNSSLFLTVLDTVKSKIKSVVVCNFFTVASLGRRGKEFSRTLWLRHQFQFWELWPHALITSQSPPLLQHHHNMH